MGGWDDFQGKKAFAMEDWWPELIFRTHIKVWGDYRPLFSDPPPTWCSTCVYTHIMHTQVNTQEFKWIKKLLCHLDDKIELNNSKVKWIFIIWVTQICDSMFKVNLLLEFYTTPALFSLIRMKTSSIAKT